MKCLKPKTWKLQTALQTNEGGGETKWQQWLCLLQGHWAKPCTRGSPQELCCWTHRLRSLLLSFAWQQALFLLIRRGRKRGVQVHLQMLSQYQLSYRSVKWDATSRHLGPRHKVLAQMNFWKDVKMSMKKQLEVNWWNTQINMAGECAVFPLCPAPSS